MSGQVVKATWASPAPVENSFRRRSDVLPAGVVHLRKPLVPNPAPSAYAEAIAFIVAALPPAAYQRATQAALRASQAPNATDDARVQSLAALRFLMADYGSHRPN